MSGGLDQDRAEPCPKPGIGIVHLGLGAFFRAHGAQYIQDVIAQTQENWGIVGVSLRSSTIRDAFAERGFEYTAVEMSDHGMTWRTIDVVGDVLFAPTQSKAVLSQMASPSTKIVSLTITEKGYCRGDSGLELELTHPDIQHDLTSPTPKSAIGYIVRSLQMRRLNGTQPFTVLSLDNLPSNGQVTRNVVLDLARQIDPDLALWISENGAFPSTMVDRIVPATTAQMLLELRNSGGPADETSVFHEPFRQWVIEHDFVDNQHPQLSLVGAQFVRDVAPFEHMKLRLLNGSHSALAYLGSLAGHQFVSQAINDPDLSAFLDEMWHQEIIPSITPPSKTDLARYVKALKSRYNNPAIKHQLAQIAMDASQKLPQRILEPLFENLATGRPYHRLLRVIAAWVLFVQTRAPGDLQDPLADELIEAVHSAKSDEELVANVMAIRPIFANYPTHKIERELTTILSELRETTQ